MSIRLNLALTLIFTMAVQTQVYSQTTLKHSANIEIQFDQQKNETMVRTRNMLAEITSSTELESIYFFASYRYLGKEQIMPDTIELSFLVEPCGREPNLAIWADGRLLHSDRLMGICFISGGRKRSTSKISLSYERFLNLSESENVEIEMEGIRFQLTELQKDVLRKLREVAKQ